MSRCDGAFAIKICMISGWNDSAVSELSRVQATYTLRCVSLLVRSHHITYIVRSKPWSGAVNSRLKGQRTWVGSCTPWLIYLTLFQPLWSVNMLSHSLLSSACSRVRCENVPTYACFMHKKIFFWLWFRATLFCSWKWMCRIYISGCGLLQSCIQYTLSHSLQIYDLVIFNAS